MLYTFITDSSLNLFEHLIDTEFMTAMLCQDSQSIVMMYELNFHNGNIERASHIALSSASLNTFLK